MLHLSKSKPKLRIRRRYSTVPNRLEQGLLPLYKRPPISFKSGKGCFLIDSKDEKYLDFMSGIAVNALGHSNSAVIRAITNQASKFVHIGNYYHHEYATKLAVQLLSPLGSRDGNRRWGFGASKDPQNIGKVFFANSGTEANEAGLKFCRKWGKTIDPSGNKHRIVSFRGAFHGRTFGALSATPNPKYQEPFEPLVPGFISGTFNNVEELKTLINDNVCGIIVEPIQGEGGVHVATEEFLLEIRKLADKNKCLVIYDEIQCGLGRTGELYAHFNYSVEASPDIISLAKPLANGVPIGASVMTNSVAEILQPGDHGTTFGGNALSCAVGCTVVKILSDPKFLSNVQKSSNFLRQQLETFKQRYSKHVIEIRGRGLMYGVQFAPDFDLNKLTEAALERKLLLITAGTQTLRLVPPLIIKESEILRGMKVLNQSMDSVLNNL